MAAEGHSRYGRRREAIARHPDRVVAVGECQLYMKHRLQVTFDAIDRQRGHARVIDKSGAGDVRTDSYSIMSGTDASSGYRRSSAAVSSTLDAPRALRIAATRTSVSRTVRSDT